jgi:osmoprotectant transport system permease protein
VGVLDYLRANGGAVIFYALQHVLVVLYSVAIGAALSVAFALAVHTEAGERSRWKAGLREGALLVTAAVLTVPSLALFVLLLPVFGLGATSAVVALTVYTLYTVLRNAVTGLAGVDPAVVEAAKGLGMSRTRRLLRIELPLAWPVILNGIRVATLIDVAIAAVAALVRGPGLGQLVLTGLSRYGAANAFNQVLVGTLGCLVVAAVYELFYAAVARLTVPGEIRGRA